MSLYPHPFDCLRVFEETFTGPGPTCPSFPEQNVRDLRVRLLQEEFDEYLEAENENDLVEIADALADMVVIIHGTAIRYGIPLDEVFAEVHRSNMSKVSADGTVLRREDGKILKPDTYSPPDIASILDRETTAHQIASLIHSKKLSLGHVAAKLGEMKKGE